MLTWQRAFDQTYLQHLERNWNVVEFMNRTVKIAVVSAYVTVDSRNVVARLFDGILLETRKQKMESKQLRSTASM